MARERADRGGEAAPPSVQQGLSIAEIRQLITLMNGSDIEEIGIEQEQEGIRLTLRKPAPVTVAASADGDVDGVDVSEVTREDTTREKQIEIGAPLVGVFRASMKGTGKPLVAVGDVVRGGQVVGAIEALNVLNEVEATDSGRVREILAIDGQPVEYGQTLLVIEPA